MPLNACTVSSKEVLKLSNESMIGSVLLFAAEACTLVEMNSRDRQAGISFMILVLVVGEKKKTF